MTTTTTPKKEAIVKLTQITQILSKRDLEANQQLVNDFFTLYVDEANFPDEDEREGPEKIKGRITEMPVEPSAADIIVNRPDPFTHLLCLELIDLENKRELAAGCIVEYYPISKCALITYVFVSPDWRRTKISYKNESKGLAEILLTDEGEGLPNLIQYFTNTYASKTLEKDEPKRVQAVFFESNNPLLTAKDSMPPHKRLNFFRDLGAKRIDFDYVQPPIGAGKPPVKNLLLLIFPQFSATGSMYVPVLTIITFVLELAKGLDKNQDDDKDKYGKVRFQEDIDTLATISKVITHDAENAVSIDMQKFIEAPDLEQKRFTLKGYPSSGNGKNILQDMFTDLLQNAYTGTALIYLSEIPKTEDPKFNFKRASITLHVLVDEDYYKVTSHRLTQENGHFVKPLPDPSSEDRSGKSSIKSERPTIQPELMYCPVCHSFETDLFSYHNQFNTPFFTKSFLFDKYVIVRFPASMPFTSEGRKEQMDIVQCYEQPTPYSYQRKSDRQYQYIPLRLAVSYTYFDRSNVRVWNLSFSSCDELPINEYIIIKLSKFFTGSQENKSLDDKHKELLDKIGFLVCDYDSAIQVKESGSVDEAANHFRPLHKAFFGKYSMIDVHYELSLRGYRRNEVHSLSFKCDERNNAIIDNSTIFDEEVTYKNVKTGTVQVDMSDDFIDLTTNNKQRPDGWKRYLSNLFNDLYYTIKTDTDTTSISKEEEDDPGWRSETVFREDVAKMLCGTTLGIFDYDRMGFEEIEDTLTPRPVSAKKFSFLTVNRGALTSYHVQTDSVLNSAWYTLGASPYLIIPNAVLTHNESVLLDADDMLDGLLSDLQTGEKAFKVKPELFVGQRNYVNDLLNDDYLKNVFHYKTERDLYDYGSSHRGIENGLQAAQEKLKQVDIMIDQLRNVRQSSYQKTVEVLGFFISLVSIFSVLKEIFTMSRTTSWMTGLETWMNNQCGVSGEPAILLLTLTIFIPVALGAVYWYNRFKSKTPVLTLGAGNYVSP
ncbi:hypothetical protein GCM10027578_27780 [Spirosoma luteolum]